MTQIALAFELSPPQPRRRPQTPVGEEIQRLNRNAQRALELLSDGEWWTNVQICDVAGLRGIGRVDELRRAGHRIEKKHSHGGIWLYRLVKPSSRV